MSNYYLAKSSTSEEARSIGISLIKEFNIDRTFDLAIFLNVNPNLNDQEAILTWTKYFLQAHSDIREFNQIRHHFMRNFPEVMFAHLTD